MGSSAFQLASPPSEYVADWQLDERAPAVRCFEHCWIVLHGDEGCCCEKDEGGSCDLCWTALIGELKYQAPAVKDREAAVRACNHSEKGDQDTSSD
jgi:hypothetical protein